MRLTLTALFLALCAWVQAQQVSHATFYSKEGYPFTIYLNDQKMNDEPQTTVRVINLTQPYYSCRAEFVDTTLKPAVRKVLVLRDANGVRVDATFVVERTKKGDMKIGWKSQSLYPRFIEEEYRPTVVVVGDGTGDVQRTTTTTRTVDPGTSSGGVNMSFGGPGGRMNINTGTSAPAEEETTTTTTVVGGTAGGSGTNLPCSGTILGTADFEEALKSIRMRSTEEGRLQSSKLIVSSNCLATDHIKRMALLFDAEQTRLDLAIYAYPFVLDKGNYFKLNGLFSQEASIDTLNNAILAK